MKAGDTITIFNTKCFIIEVDSEKFSYTIREDGMTCDGKMTFDYYKRVNIIPLRVAKLKRILNESK